MAEKKKHTRALFIFYALVIYGVAQFLWWSFLLVKQGAEMSMVVGEGTVFLGIMFLGVLHVQRSYRRERELLARQNTFLHSVTHEFKSPVASLRLQLETLQKLIDNGQWTMDNEKSLNNCSLLLSNAIEDTDRLDRLLEKTLTAARIDNGELPLMEEYMNLSLRLNELLAQIAGKNPQRTILPDVQNDVFMKIDPWALESIITNLVENAFLYSLPDKPVVIALKQEANNIVLSIKDEGVGIPDKEKQKIFQKFYRIDATAGYKGTGLGLFLVNYLVKKHNGTIVVKDNKPKGSVFEITFPVAAHS